MLQAPVAKSRCEDRRPGHHRPVGRLRL